MENEKTQTHFENLDNKESLKENEIQKSDRIVVFGTRGYQTMMREVEKDLGLGSNLYAVREATNIEDGFYGVIGKKYEISYPEPEYSKTKKIARLALGKAIESMLPKVNPENSLSTVLLNKTINYRESIKPDNDTSYIKTEIPVEKTLPEAVIIFPEMRQGVDQSGGNSTIETPVELIKKLCIENDVKYIEIKDKNSETMREEVEGAILDLSSEK